ncbi:hypothetical protein ABZ477_03780 [Microbacterium sp. NPDC019599]|uniref:hypothetical protein n=1 Tax=Microbacterium sp. NPDC019599 TaxID=3154690 RepID=UPI0033E99E59
MIVALIVEGTELFPPWIWVIPFLIGAFFIGAWLASVSRKPRVAQAYAEWTEAEDAAAAFPDTDSAKSALIVAAHERFGEWKRLDEAAFGAGMIFGLLSATFIAPPVGILAQII